MIYSIIPARGGSKGVPHKNIVLLEGYPLLSYAICASKLCKEVTRTIVSTDSEEIANIASRYGAEVPFLRPKALAQDTSTDLDVLLHAIKWLSDNEKKIPEYIAYLRPTTPLRNPLEITKALDKIRSIPDSTSLRSVHKLSEPPQKEMQLDKDGFLTGFFPDDSRPEYYNLPRQSFPCAYHPNGYVDIIKTEFMLKNNSLFGLKAIGFITAITTEVDMPEDFDYIQFCVKKYGNPVYEYLLKNFPKEK